MPQQSTATKLNAFAGQPATKPGLAEKVVRDAIKRAKKKLKASEAVICSKAPLSYDPIRTYLQANAAKIAGSYHAFRARHPYRKVDWDLVLQTATKIQFSEPIDEHVRLFWIPKGSGGERPVCDFGPVWRATAYTIKPIIDLVLSTNRRPFQCFFDGYAHAVRKARQYIEDGYFYVCHLDIKNFYPSVRVDELGKMLPLSKGVVSHVCALKDAHVVSRAAGGKYVPVCISDEKIRQSLPQGLPIAPFIAEIIVSKLDWKQTKNIVMINFADNFLILGKSIKKVEKAADALRSAVAGLSGGSFGLKPAEVATVSAGFEFLGHDFQLVDGELILRPGLAADNEAARTMDEYLEEFESLWNCGKTPISSHERALTILGRMLAFIQSWRAAFGECPEIGFWVDPYLDVIDEAAVSLGATSADVKAHYDKAAEFYWSGYS